MKKLLVVLVCCVIAQGAMADWDPIDGHKMHYPQLPDPNGWDVDVTRGFVADDWQCSESGAVDDIHFWMSAEHDYMGNGIDFIEVTIYGDVPAGQDPNQEVTWSHPEYDNELWFSRIEDVGDPLSTNLFTIRDPEVGDQGWYTPQEPSYWNRPDHQNFYQVNIQDIKDPFIQEKDTIYWLEIHIIPNAVPGGESPFFGWKTSLDHWNDDGVYEDLDYNWQELFNPMIQEPTPVDSLDLAFVINPEPATLAMLGLGGLVLAKKRRK